MQSQANKLPLRTRKILRHKLDKHKKFQKLTTKLYQTYCSITGFLHVRPDFLIIGFPKCGTTSLYEYLIEHPDIYPPIGKEIDYFDRLYNKGIDWYKVRFPSIFQKNYSKKICGKKFLTGEATPRYIIHPHASERIKKIIPNSKFIVILRNPVDRAFSHYQMNLKNDYEYYSFDEAIKNEKKRIEGRYEKMIKDQNYYSWDYDLFAYMQQGIYFEKIKKWLEIFPKEQFLFIQSEIFLKNPSVVYHQTLNFLQLSKWEPEEYRLFKKSSDDQSNINPQLRKQLIDFFKPYNEKLFELIGTRFDWNE